MNKVNKSIWRKNFEITRTHLQMATPALYDMMVLQKPTVDKTLIHDGIWIQQGYDNIGTYFERNQLRNIIEKTLEIIVKQPAKLRQLHSRALKYNSDLFKFSKSLLTLNYSKLTDRQLATIYDKFVKLFVLSHGYALPTTWFLDSDGEDFSNLLLKDITDLVVSENSNLIPAEVFSILTSPNKVSLAVKEEIASVKIAILITQNYQAKKLFLSKDIKKIANGLVNLEPSLRRKIFNHYKKWCWQSYTYMGPAYDLNYYLEVWSGLIRQKINLSKELSRLEKQPRLLKAQKTELIRKLNIPQKILSLCETAKDIIYLKSYRKDAWFFTCYALEPLYKEIGRRLGLSLNQVWFMAWWEVLAAIKQGSFDADLLNERMKFCVYYQKGDKGIIYSGKQAKEFLKKVNFEKEKKAQRVDEFRGTCAFPGKVSGQVKIINQVEEIGKMEQGNIMLAHTTYPALVPAMKKAGAIVTDDGGVTCHAAIVARELKIPGVVGTKIATKILKDGDKVEVDATKGIVKKIK